MKVALILVWVIVVALAIAVAAGVASSLGAFSLGGGNRGETAPTPVLIAQRFYPAGTPATHIDVYDGVLRRLPRRDDYPQEGAIGDPQYLTGRVTIVDIHSGQQLTRELFATR